MKRKSPYIEDFIMLLCIKLMFKIKRNNIYLNQFNTLNFGDILLVGFSQLFVWSYQNNFRDFGDTFPPAILSFLKVLYILNAKVEYPISTISRLQTMTKKHIVRERERERESDHYPWLGNLKHQLLFNFLMKMLYTLQSAIKL